MSFSDTVVESQNGWQDVLLGDARYFKLATGGTPSTERQDYWENGRIPWLSSGEVHKKIIRSADGRITEKGFQNSNARFYPTHSILIALAGQGKTRGTVAITEIETTSNQSIAALIPNKELVQPYFVYYYLDSLYQELRSISAGAGRAGLSLAILADVSIKLPDKRTQERITAVLSCIDRAIEQTQALIAKQKRIKTGLMQDLLTKGIDEHGNIRSEATHGFKDCPTGAIPKEWEYVRLGDYYTLPSGQVDPKEAPYCDWALIAPDHIESATGRLLTIQTARELGAISGKYQFKAGDVIYSKIRPYLRKAILADRTGLCSADMYPLRANQKIDSAFLLALILSEAFSRFATAASDRSGFPKLNRNELGEYYTAIPDYEEQIKITTILNQHDFSLIEEEVSLKKLKQIKAGLMRDLLTGEN